MPPWRRPFPITKYAITLEWIKIIKFCLKICDPWTLLHTYRLGLMCRWGVSYFKWHFYVFDAKKYSCDPPNIKFSCFCTGSHWTMFRLTTDSNFDLPTHLWTLSNVTLNEDQSTKLDLMLICQRTVKQKKISNVPLDALTCPLPIINWHWTPIIDPSWCKCMLYPPPIQCWKLLDRP